MSDSSGDRDSSGHSVCSWWKIYSFDNPLRKLVQPPDRVLAGLVAPGDHCLDIGCGMGYFSIPLARLVGPSGSVTAVDVQRRMLDGLMRRARRHGLGGAIAARLASDRDWDAPGRYDFVLAFWMVHEVPELDEFLGTVRRVLRDSGRVLLVEPRLHVSRPDFEQTLGRARSAGFQAAEGPKVFASMSALLTRSHGSGNNGGSV
jgi:ubiquinone/menaquinone biosynthesis C-methylase UbiE